MRSRRSTPRQPSFIWVLVWVIGSILPILPYTSTLWTATLSDNPYAYLIWVPVFAFVWASWSIWKGSRGTSDAELGIMLGTTLLFVSGALLVVGRLRWDLVFISQSVGLLLWPFWALGLAWVLFGIQTTTLVWRPLTYLLLAWPPLYTILVSATNPFLDAVANWAVRELSTVAGWITLGNPVGTYLVHYGHSNITVYVTSVCSGADSLLAMLILFPIIMVSFVGGVGRKVILTLIGAILSLLANLVRLFIIIFTLHGFGPGFALGVLHPVLGLLLFTVMVMFIFWLAGQLGLKNRSFRRTGELPRPGTFRLTTSVLAVGVLTWLLIPLYHQSLGSVRKPVPLQTSNLAQLMPTIAGWHQQLIGNYDEASILGPGAKSTAVSYTTFQGDYALTEMWLTYHPLVLQGYSEQDCLLFHGSKIIDQRQLTLPNSIRATVYTVLLPPKQVGGTRDMFVDTVYSYSAKYQGHDVYIRVEAATPVMLGVTPDPVLDKQVAVLMEKLANPAYRNVHPIAPVDANRTVHLQNYFTFIHQYTSKVLQS